MSYLTLIKDLIHREVLGRYRGSMLGILWSLINPLFFLAVYTFVFGVVMKSKWGIPTHPGKGSTSEFAIILFAGLIVFQFFSEVTSSSPMLVVGNSNYVKRIVFPIVILPTVSAGAALFHLFVSMIVLVVFELFVYGLVPLTIVWAPIVIAPLFLMVVGIGWFLSAAGVYFRDISQIIQPIVTASMFLSPVLFPTSAVPENVRGLLFLNPLTIPVDAFRAVVIFGTQPNWTALGYYSLVAIAVALLGEQFFQKTRRGFADVL